MSVSPAAPSVALLNSDLKEVDQRCPLLLEQVLHRSRITGSNAVEKALQAGISSGHCPLRQRVRHLLEGPLSSNRGESGAGTSEFLRSFLEMH